MLRRDTKRRGCDIALPLFISAQLAAPWRRDVAARVPMEDRALAAAAMAQLSVPVSLELVRQQ